MAAVTNATSVKIVRFESHFITLDDGPTIELMTLPDLPDAPFIGWAHIAINVGSCSALLSLSVHKNSVSFLHRPATARFTSYGYHIVK
jgi:hypothetical protein